ncbi:MAG TPA: HNH endonuclease signature motif containing protein, partial [Ilumatobacter sp.]|nr:HNH endonuclease signature motif containing protein [Ilumatobacter sp.]
RRMLAAMYATCAHPHCQVPFSACRIHHIVWWTRGGKTTLANSLPLCETHHHLVHEGGWHLSIDEQRHVTWTRPDGTVWLTDGGPNRPPPARDSTRRRERPADQQPDPPDGARPLQPTLL